MAKKIIAILMAMALVLSFAACGGKEETKEPDTTAAEDVTAAPEETTDALPAEDTTAAEETTEAPTEAPTEATTEAPASKAPESKAEIIEYFNTAVNGVKTGAKSVTMNYEKISLAGSTTLPGILNGVLKLLGGADEFLGDQLAKNSKGKEVFNGTSAIQGRFPVEGETWASKLTESDVKSATCEEKDGKYYITVITLSDGKTANVQHGQGHVPKAFNAVLPGVVNDNIPGVATSLVGTATMNYPSSKASIVVDIETGHVLTADYDLYWTINFDKAGAILPFLTADSYTVAW